MQMTLPSRAVLLLCAAGLLSAIAAGCASPPTSASPDGKILVAEQCGRCHPIERVNGVRKDRTGWTATVTRMRSNGLVVTDEQAAAIVDYLSTRDAGK